jgi:hypothetical protein
MLTASTALRAGLWEYLYASCNAMNALVRRVPMHLYVNLEEDKRKRPHA